MFLKQFLQHGFSIGFSLNEVERKAIPINRVPRHMVYSENGNRILIF